MISFFAISPRQIGQVRSHFIIVPLHLVRSKSTDEKYVLCRLEYMFAESVHAHAFVPHAGT